MALIRNSSASTIAREAIVLDLGDLREQGERIVQGAREEAARIVAEARAERARILAGAAETGHAEGLARGLEEGRVAGRARAAGEALAEHRAQLNAVEQAWMRALGEFNSAREEMVQGALRDVVRLAATIGERVTKRTIELNPEVVQDQLAAVLGVIVRPTELIVRIHPADRELAAKALPQLLAAMPAIRHAELLDDEAVERGGCTATTRAEAEQGDAGGGRIDATISAQLDRLVETLLPADTDAPEAGGET